MYSAVDACGNEAAATVDVTVYYGARIEVEVVDHTEESKRHCRASKEPLVGVVVGVYDRTRESCVMEQVRQARGLPREGYEAAHEHCEPVNTAVTDADGIAVLDLPPGRYMLVAPIDTDGDAAPDQYAGKPVGHLGCGAWKTARLKLSRKP